MEPFDLFCLVGRHDLGDHTIDADLAGDRLGGPLVVAGEHRHLETIVVQFGDGRRGRVAEGVGDTQRATYLPIPAHQKDGTARRRDLLHRVKEPTRDLQATIGHQLRLADNDLGLVDHTDDPLTPQCLKLRRSDKSDAMLLSAKRHRLPDRVLTGGLHRPGQEQEPILVPIGEHVGERHRPSGQGPGLVEYHGVHRLGSFEHFSVLEQHS